MKDKLEKLINTKTLVTLMLTVVFCVLALMRVVNAEQFLMIFTTVIAFYFGTQHEKNTTKSE